MGNAFIKESTLTDIANAIRAKTGGTDLLLPSQMADEINNIETGKSSGLYAWRKIKDETKTYTSTLKVTVKMQDSQFVNPPTVTLTPTIPNYILTEPDIIGLELVTTTWSPSSTDSALKFIFKANGSWEFLAWINMGDAGYGWVSYGGPVHDVDNRKWHLTSGNLALPEATDSNYWDQSFSGSKTIIKTTGVETIVGYVVSDNPSDYPTNGIHTDGFKYVKL